MLNIVNLKQKYCQGLSHFCSKHYRDINLALKCFISVVGFVM